MRDYINNLIGAIQASVFAPKQILSAPAALPEPAFLPFDVGMGDVKKLNTLASDSWSWYLLRNLIGIEQELIEQELILYSFCITLTIKRPDRVFVVRTPIIYYYGLSPNVIREVLYKARDALHGCVLAGV